MENVYHEKQGEDGLCGMHCLNNLLQGPFFNFITLAEISAGLDAAEREQMAVEGEDTDDFKKFQKEGSSNVSLSGDFSANVLHRALYMWGLECSDTRAPAKRDCIDNPMTQTAFVCNLDAHWTTIRKLPNGVWWHLDSLKPKPELLKELYLGVFLKQLQLEGWTVYVVEGTFPNPLETSTDDFSNQEVPNQGYNAAEDAEIAAAIAASLAEVIAADNASNGQKPLENNAVPKPPQNDTLIAETIEEDLMIDDPELAEAIRISKLEGQLE